MKVSVAMSEDVRLSEGFNSRASQKVGSKKHGVTSDPHIFTVKGIKQTDDLFDKATVSAMNNSQSEIGKDESSSVSSRVNKKNFMPHKKSVGGNKKVAEIILIENMQSLDNTIPEDIDVTVDGQVQKEILDEGLPKTPNRNGACSNDSINSQHGLKSSPSKQLLSIQTLPLIRLEESPKTLKEE